MPRKKAQQHHDRPKLPAPGDPFVTADGRVIQPDSLKDIGLLDPQPLDVSPQDFRATRARNMDELVAEPKMVVACAAVMTLTMLGISDREILEVLRITDEQLVSIRTHAVYEDCFNACYSELINANSSSLQARIAGYAHGALSNVVLLAATAKKDEVRLSANRDILDRAGTKAADHADREKGKTSSLRIAILKGDTTIEVSNIDV